MVEKKQRTKLSCKAYRIYKANVIVWFNNLTESFEFYSI